ncbi:MAG: DUF5004 domain-containing protein [Chitinophagaceae bacterium]|nr:DUF5004 domain-containing protein [Chitinophagaceae bacterium]
MKCINKIAVVVMLATIVFAACRPASFEDMGVQRNFLQSVNGTWKLTKSTQVDEDATKNGFPYQQLYITNLFPYTSFVLTLNVSSNAPTTFLAVPGTSPKIVKLNSGNWTVDNLNYPKNIYLSNGASTDTITLGGYPVGASNTLKLIKEKRDATTGKLLISYSYEFAKQ